MKKVIFLLLLVTAVALAACGGDNETPSPTAEAQEVQATEAPPEESPTEVPATEAPPEKSPTEVLATETPAEETAPTDSPLASMEHTPDPLLVDITWQWERRDTASGTTEIAVPNPDAYTILFNADGTLSATLDCKSANGQYKTPSSGSIFMELDVMTAVECSESSLSNDMANMFGPAQNYRLEEENEVLVFSWAAGGPVDYYRNAEAASDEAEVESIPAESIEIDLQGLAETYSWVIQPSTPIPPGPGGLGFPSHILLTFDGETAENALANNSRRMYIFPTQAYLNLYAEAGNTSVSTQVTRLEQLIAEAETRQGIPADPMPLLPPPSSFMNRWAQFSDLDFGVGNGVRYVSEAPNRQDIGPWTNQGTAYYYQGLTSDGNFYVSLIWPVTTESLPNTSADVPADVTAAATNPETNPAYLQQTKDALNALPSTSWTPDLAQLDALSASITFPTAAEAAPEDETEDEIDLPKPEAGEPTGTVTAPDGIFIRSGPGTEYPSVGVAPFGETGEIIGVSEDGQWWVVDAPAAPNEQGWVSAAFVDVTNTDNVPVIPTPALEPLLTGTTWQWVSTTTPTGVTAVNDPTRYTILFNEDGSAAVKADCNNVTATYTVDGSNINITLGASTLAACPPDSLDQQFQAGLSNAAITFFQEGDLYMDMTADAGTMRFSALQVSQPIATPPSAATPNPDSPVGSALGIEFQLASFGPVGAEQPVLAGSQITALFSETDVAGIAGCNNYAGTLTPVNDFFTVGPIVTTRKACAEPAGVMEQEQAYLAALEATDGFQWQGTPNITAGQLRYTLADGTSGVMNFITP